jgi:hypothetical protein
MRQEDQGDCKPYNYPICSMIGTLKQLQVTYEKGNFEEADSELVDRSAGVVDTRVQDKIFFGSQ